MALIDLLPPSYRLSTEVVELQGAFEHWTEALKEAKQDMLLQMNVTTATWGTNIWEKALGIEIDISKTLEYRRTRVMSKLRGAGTTTEHMIKNVAESFSNGQVDILEYNSESRFEIKFTGTFGIPPNMDDLTAAINEIKPAHLDYSYAYVYRVNNQLIGYTNTQLLAYTNITLRSGELI